MDSNRRLYHIMFAGKWAQADIVQKTGRGVRRCPMALRVRNELLHSSPKGTWWKLTVWSKNRGRPFPPYVTASYAARLPRNANS